MPDEIPFIRKEFSDAVARRLYPALKREGLSRQGKRTWYDKRPDGSWVLMELMLYHTTRHSTKFTVTTAVWPPGTWKQAQQSSAYRAAYPVPFVAANSPISGRPEEVAPQLWSGDDFRQVKLGDDLDATMDGLLEFLLAALDWGRRLCVVEAALDFLTRPFDMQTHRHAPDHRLAIVMLREAAPGHPRLPELVDTFTQRWRADPMPITLRADIVSWRAEAGLPPEPDLPTYWHAAMLPSNIERYGWPGSALQLPGGEFWHADGTKSTTPPPGWPTRS